MHLLSRSVEPVSRVNLCGGVIRGDIQPVKQDKMVVTQFLPRRSDGTDINLIPDTSLQSDTPGLVSSGLS